MIGTDSERESGESILSVRLDDDDDNEVLLLITWQHIIACKLLLLDKNT